MGFAASSLHLHSLAMCLDLGWVPPEDDLETEMHKSIIHLLGDGRKHQRGREDVREGRKGSHPRMLYGAGYHRQQLRTNPR